MTVPPSDVARMIAARARLADYAALFSPGVEPPPPLSPRLRRDLRAKLFAERPLETARRMAVAARSALVRDGLAGSLRGVELMARDRTIGALGLPDPARALASPEGLCGAADDLSVATVMDAYERGMYPSGHLGPMKWWSPSLRAVVSPADLIDRLSGEQADTTIAFDRNFEAALCDGDADQPTPPRLKWAFAELFDAGFAHCFDVSLRSGERIGGGYGVAVGRVFVIESLRVADEKQRARVLAALARGLDDRGFAWIDAKRLTPDLAGLGFDGLPRVGYVAKLKCALYADRIGRWSAPPLQEAA